MAYPYSMTDEELKAAIAKVTGAPPQLGVTSIGGRPVVQGNPSAVQPAPTDIQMFRPPTPAEAAAAAARAAGSNSGPLGPGNTGGVGMPAPSARGIAENSLIQVGPHMLGVGTGTQADVANLGTIATQAGNYAAGQADTLRNQATGVQAATGAMASDFTASGDRAVPTISVMGGANPTAQQGSTLANLRAMDPSAPARSALAATQGADVSGAARSALSQTAATDVSGAARSALAATQAAAPGQQVEATLGNVRALDVASPTERALQSVQSATPQAPATSALSRLRAFDSSQPSAAQAMLADNANQEFANSLALARTGGTATERAWNLAAAQAQNFERQAQVGRTMAGVRATEQRDQKAQELQALQSEGALATNIGQLDLSRLGLESNTAQAIGQLGLGKAGLELQGASNAGELALQKLVAANSAAANVGQLDLGKLNAANTLATNVGQLNLGQLNAANAAAANVGQLDLGRSAQELQAAQGVDATRLQANTTQAQLDATLQQLNDQYQIANRELGANTYLQGAQLGMQGATNAANIGLMGYQLPYQAQQDIMANSRAEIDQNMQLMNLILGRDAQRAQIDAQRDALPWQVAGGGVGAIASALPMLALSDKRAKTAIERLRDDDAAAGAEATPAYRYRYRAGVGEDTEETHVGPMAQDLERISKSLVRKRPDGLKEVRIDRLALHTHAAVGSALRRLRALESKAA